MSGQAGAAGQPGEQHFHSARHRGRVGDRFPPGRLPQRAPESTADAPTGRGAPAESGGMRKNACAWLAVLTFACAGWAWAQDLPPAASSTPPIAVATARPAAESVPRASAGGIVRNVPLIVPRGTPLEIALDEEVRVKKAGQEVRGKVIEAVYAFDRVVIPTGTVVTGHITSLESISTGQRTLSVLDANFTPDHKVTLEFEDLVLANGTHMKLRTTVTPGTGNLMEFVQAKEEGGKKGVKQQASEQVQAAKQRAKQTWNDAMKQVTEPGRMHRLQRYIYSQLPIHPHYLDAGTLYSAELEDPLNFGSTPLTAKMASTIGRRPAPGSVVHARLLTPLSSATATDGEKIEAVLSQPLFDGNSLLYPTGSSLKGVVLQAVPAHKLHHNGQLRIVFHGLQAPEGLEQKVTAVPVGVAAAKMEHLELDSEGGAQATSPKTRYLHTAMAIGLAATSSGSDSDARDGGGEAGNTSNRVAGGAGGFKLVGILMGAFVHSQPLGMAMGAVGASRSIYGNFLSQGREVVFPKNTAMDVSVGGNPPPAVCRTPASGADAGEMGNAAACTLRYARIF
jgi:hypothetical protein